MFIAEFLTLKEKTNYNVRLTFFEYLNGKLNRRDFLKKLGKKYNKNFNTEFYYKGVRIWI